MRQYKLIGFLNMFSFVPDFVYPIFQNEGVYYFQEGYNDKINDFVPVKSSVYSMIKKIDSYEEFVGKNNIILTVDTKPIYAFQIEQNKLVCGDSNYILEFFKSYSTDNVVLREEIEDLKNELVNSMNSQKNKEKVSLHEIRYTHRKGGYWGLGRRKNSAARVYLVPGTGKITINKRDINEYFKLETLKLVVCQPLVATETVDKFDVLVNVKGGGYTGQAGAIRNGIARALLQVDANYLPTLKASGYLTRVPRMKERKEYSLKAARRMPHLSKK